MVVQVDCSAIDPAGLEEKLFGREGGAPGLFREADGGTLLLEEVDRLPPGAQARLLHASQRREVLALDAAQPIAVDVRILAVAGPALREAVDAGRFRQDLYYRLSAFSVELPPLRDCREDIYAIANEFMEEICQRYHIPDKALSDTDIIYPEHIHLDAEPVPLTLRQHMRQEERRYIQQVLLQCGGDRKLAMKQLDVSRSVFYDRLKEYGLG